MGVLLKLRLLLWKNFLVRRRNKIRFILEAVYPLFIFAVIVLQNPQSNPRTFESCEYAEKALPSAGKGPFLHSFLNISVANNYCLNKDGKVSYGNFALRSNPADSKKRSPRSLPPHKLGESLGPDCEAAVISLMSISQSPTTYRDVIQPFITGKILYYPETTATRKIMESVNETFNMITSLPETFPVKDIVQWPGGREYMLTYVTLYGHAADVEAVKNLPDDPVDTSGVPAILLKLYDDFRNSFEKCVNREKVQAVTPEQALNASWTLLNTTNLWALVEFDDVGEELNPLVKYKIRMSEKTLPSTRTAKVPFKNKGRLGQPLQHLQYISYGFAYLQDMIDSAVLSIHTGRKDADRPGVILQQFPAASYTVDELGDLLGQVLPLLMVIAWIYTFSQTVKGIVVEKEERVKEVLAVMGVSRGVQSAGWVLEGICTTFITCIVLSALLKFGGLMKNSDVTLLVVLLVSFVLAMQAFALFVATFFSRPTLAGPCSGVIYFLTYYVYQLVRPAGGEDPSALTILAGSLVSNVALAEATLIVTGWELSGKGAQWSNAFAAAGAGEPISLAGCIGMMWLDALIYAVLAWYTENVFPGEFGVPKPFYFFLQKSYWFGSEEESMILEMPQKDQHNNAGNFEAEPPNSTVGVAIENLSKVFGKQKPAVNGLTLNFHQDQINCFLGHNGAGKTTTISMLTGMYPPTAGTARLFGRDIRTEMDAIRSSMGVCPQHNVLFGSLTVQEHLLFFGRIKGISEDVLKKEIDYMLAEMGLEDKRDARSNTLSGGMKRKLSVGMAFVGGSKVVFLDEPTAGVDPFSRRGIWELLLKFRKGRTIILTTHFMDEADLLGDRIAIMSEGQLQCCGSSVFLKERLGSGYHLTVEWQENSRQTIQNWKTMLTQEILLKVPAARRVQAEGPEESQAVFVLPDRHDVAAITALLEELERKRDALSVASYGVSDTSLEEIFLKVAENKAKEDTSDAVTVEYDDSSACDLLQEPVTGWRLLVQQYAALTRKRFQYVKRDPRALFTQLALPAFFVTLALALSSTQSGSGPMPELPLHTDMFGEPVVSFYEQLQGSTWSDQYLGSMLANGVGSSLAEGYAIQRSERTGDDSTCSNSPPNPLNVPLSSTLPSGELFYNANDSDVDAWLLSSYNNCRRNRFGGVTFGAQYKKTRASMNQKDNVKVWFNSDGFASVPTYMNAINNVLLRASLPAGTDASKYGIAASSWPLPPDPALKENQEIDTLEISLVLSSAITVIFAMSFVPASFVMFLVEDRTGQSKHLQLVSGLRSYIYWLQSYTWDMVSFTASELLVIIIFFAFQTPMYTAGANIWAVVFLLFTYGMACTPLLYLLSWFFRIPSMAFLVLSTGNLFIGLVSTVLVMVMKITNPDAVDAVQSVLMVLPQFCLGQGLMNMAMNYFKNQVLTAQGQPTVESLTWDVTGKYVVAMLIMSGVLAVAVFLAEQSTHWWHGFMQNHSNVVESREEDEEDVRREGQRVEAGQADQGMLVLKRLTKRYKRKATPAVAGVSFGVDRGQCFGLLGLNGAGKTSIFKMLTGDTLISGGDAMVAGRSVRADMDAVRQMTGYCPQFDALVPLLTVTEHLELYSSIHGIPAAQRPAAVRRAIQMFDLEQHKGKQAKSLSGGNKRKLSAAISLVGDPSLLYLDEPTTSMDPVARRFVWERVRKVVAAGRSVLLTSHSMEECEALCDRLTIMVNGKLTCIGSPQHLKHKYGSGYMAVVRCPLDRVAEAQTQLVERMPGTVVKEAHLSQIKLQIPPHTLLVDIFRSLDDARRQGCLTDYSVSQTTLEDVFMQFAEAQKTQAQ